MVPSNIKELHYKGQHDQLKMQPIDTLPAIHPTEGSFYNLQKTPKRTLNVKKTTKLKKKWGMALNNGFSNNGIQMVRKHSFFFEVQHL